MISLPGEKARHTFTLVTGALLTFDSLTNTSSITWSLTGPAGTAVSNRTFGTPDGTNAPILNLVAGDYTLTVDATGDATGPYSFRLRDLTSGSPITIGNPVSATLDPANETDLYRFSAAAGDRFFFDGQGGTANSSATWRLVDPYGAIVFSTAFFQDVNNLTLNIAGTYTLLIVGAATGAA